MKDRRTIRETIVDGCSWDNKDEIPENLVDAIKWLCAKLQMVPRELADSAVLDIESYYESSVAQVSIYYHRPETDKEMIERNREEEEWAKQRRAEEETRERQVYQFLHEKYGSH